MTDAKAALKKPSSMAAAGADIVGNSLMKLKKKD